MQNRPIYARLGDPGLLLILPWEKICLTYSEGHDLVIAGDPLGNLFSWKVAEVAGANTEEGDSPPHHTLGPPFQTKR